jgi:hypothetical protein
MLMKTRSIDFHHVEDGHKEIDKALQNWARWVRVSHVSWVSPMFRQAQSNARQWHQPEIRETCDLIAAQAMEKAIYQLPERHRYAVRWRYVYCGDPYKAQKKLGATQDGLAKLIRDGLQMLVNRGY